MPTVLNASGSTLQITGTATGAVVASLDSGIVTDNSFALGLPGGGPFTNIDASAAIGTSFSLVGNGSANVIAASNAPSSILGLGGNDTLIGGNDDDTLSGGGGLDSIVGGGGSNVLQIHDSTDVVAGEVYDGGATGGLDTLQLTAAGTYDLSGVTIISTEIFVGSTGNDLVTITAAQFAGFSTLTLNSGVDRLTVTAAAGALSFGAVSGVEAVSIDQTGTVTLTNTGGQVIALNGAFDDTLNGSGTAETVFGGDGNDSLQGNAGNDVLVGEAGADILSGGADNDTLHGGDGADQLLGGTGDDMMLGGAGSDTLVSGDGIDTLFGGDGADSLVASTGASDQGNFFVGDIGAEVGNDTIEGSSGNDTAYGGNGDDWIEGRGGDDMLLGEAGADTLFGGTGSDTLWGGSGNDRFYLQNATGNDMIADFNAGDVIYLQTYGFTTFADMEAALTANNGVTSFSNGIQLTFGASTLTIIGLTSLDASAFAFPGA